MLGPLALEEFVEDAFGLVGSGGGEFVIMGFDVAGLKVSVRVEDNAYGVDGDQRDGAEPSGMWPDPSVPMRSSMNPSTAMVMSTAQ